MRINFFITTLGGGGAERVLTNLANYLSDKKYSVEIGVLRKTEIKYEIHKSINIVFLEDLPPKKKHLPKHFREISIAKQYLKSKRKDDVVVAFLELPMLLSLHFKKKMKCRLVVSERSHPLYYSKIYRFLLYHLVSRADAAVFQTEEVKKWYRKFKGLSYVIPNSINKRFMDACYSTFKGKNIVSVGRIDSNKNHKLLIDAFSTISEKHLDYQVKIFGDGPLKNKLIDYVNELGLSNRIIFKGFCNDIVSELLDADIFVLTSKLEGMPNSLMEAMALGVPSITTNCFGNSGKYQLVEPGENAIMIPCNSKKELAESIEELITNDRLREKLKNNSIKVRFKFSPETIYKQWEKLLLEVFNKND